MPWESVIIYLFLLVVLMWFHSLFLRFCIRLYSGEKASLRRVLVVSAIGALNTAVFLPFFFVYEQLAGLFCAALLVIELRYLLPCKWLWAAFLGEAFLLHFLFIHSVYMAVLGRIQTLAIGGFFAQKNLLFTLMFLLLSVLLWALRHRLPVQWMTGAGMHKKQLLLLAGWTALANLYMIFNFGFFTQPALGPPFALLLVIPALILLSFYAAVGVSAAISRILDYEEEPEELPYYRGRPAPPKILQGSPASDLNIWRYSYLSKLLSVSETPYKTVYHVLSVLTNQYTFSRGYIFQVVPNGEGLQNTFEWCDSGTTAQIAQLQDLPRAWFPTIQTAFQKHKMFIMEDLSVLAQEEQAHLKNQNICSMLHFAFYEEGRFKGLIGFDDCMMCRRYSTEMIHELQIFSQMLAGYLLRHPDIAKEAAEHIAKGHTLQKGGLPPV